jgi:hypothetical protein
MHLHKLQSLVILGMMRDLCRAFAVEQLTIQQLQTYGATYLICDQSRLWELSKRSRSTLHFRASVD